MLSTVYNMYRSYILVSSFPTLRVTRIPPLEEVDQRIDNHLPTSEYFIKKEDVNEMLDKNDTRPGVPSYPFPGLLPP